MHPTRAHILGDLKNQPRCGHSAEFFIQRDCWVDCRAPDTLIIDPLSNWGWNVTLVTLSHDPNPGMFGRTYGMRLRVDAHAFVAGFCILYNCHIGEGAVVAVGSVVRSMYVSPWTMVAGNPARVVARLIEGRWLREEPETGAAVSPTWGMIDLGENAADRRNG